MSVIPSSRRLMRTLFEATRDIFLLSEGDLIIGMNVESKCLMLFFISVVF
jgi:hypothetical protein